MIYKQGILFALLSLISTQIFAANWYKVELVVFEHLTPDNSGEVWDVSHEYPDLGRSVELISSVPGDEAGLIAFQTLAGRQKQLGGVYSALKSSRQYRPIMHVGWQQPGMNGPNARRVHVNMDDGFQQKIDGSVRIRSGHFLYVDVDLAYFLGLASPDEVNSNAPFSRMTETRKVKLNELHYFDHPLFGIVLRVSRL